MTFKMRERVRVRERVREKVRERGRESERDGSGVGEQKVQNVRNGILTAALNGKSIER